MIPAGALEHEVLPGAIADGAVFDRVGYTVGRGLFAPEAIRAVRGPLIEALIADGCVEPDEGDEDRFRWVGDKATFSRFEYEPALRRGVDELLLSSGVAGRAIAVMWGRRPAIREGVQLFTSLPGAPDGGRHRDFLPMVGTGGRGEYARLWCPLTRLGREDGALGIAVGSHLLPNEPTDDPPGPHALHSDISYNTGNPPSDDQLAPLWRTTRLAIGDALVFRPDVIHGATRNSGSCLRLALVLSAQDARLPQPVSAGLSLDSGRDLTDVEWLALAVLAVQPTSIWHMRCAFYARGIIGRQWIEQPSELVERVFVTLESRGQIEPHDTHAGKPALQRVFTATLRGRLDVCGWLTTPECHDQRILALKTLFCEWLDLDTTDLPAGTHEHAERGGSPVR